MTTRTTLCATTRVLILVLQLFFFGGRGGREGREDLEGKRRSFKKKTWNLQLSSVPISNSNSNSNFFLSLSGSRFRLLLLLLGGGGNLYSIRNCRGLNIFS